MKTLLRLEELAQFLVCLYLLISSHVAWWTYLLLVIGPDIGMLGYLVNVRVGAITYNLFHHKGIAICLMALGSVMAAQDLVSALFGSQSMSGADVIFGIGIILYGHASMDRALGYGLKYSDDFKHTHLGWIGKKSEQ